MSDCRMCDTCGQVFSVLDTAARRMSVEEQVMTGQGSARQIQTVVRDMCGQCFGQVNKKRQPAAIDAANAPTVAA